jgi:glutamine synthetase
MSFIEDFGLWTAADRDTAAEVLSRTRADGVETVRVSFVDPHGLLRTKSVAADLLPRVFEDGLTAVSTLLSKDTSGRTVFAAFSPDGGVGVPGMGGAGDMVMVPDPSTFRVLPWAERTAWLLCDLRLRNGDAVPFCSRSALRTALGRAAERGFELLTGIEVEFHLFRPAGTPLGPQEVNRPGAPGRADSIQPLDRGYQLLSEDRADALEPFLSAVGRALRELGIPLRTTEIEFGPSQIELTTGTQLGMASADSMVLLRSAVRQVARRQGYLATFMCRPQAPETCSSGWHLHQSLVRRDGEGHVNAFAPADGAPPCDGALSPVGRSYVAGLLRHARAGCVFVVPTVNGYKRFQPYSMAPDRVLWAHDNRAAMIRVVGSVQAGDTHVENRVGEPAANPYLALAAQLVSGLDGVDRRLDPGPSADEPYATEATRLPTSLGEAVRALEEDRELHTLLGPALVDHYAGLKRAEVSRFEAAVTDWEQREYLHLF